MNCHTLARKQGKMDNAVGPTFARFESFFGFSAYCIKNEAVLHNNMLVYNHPCRLATKTV